MSNRPAICEAVVEPEPFDLGRHLQEVRLKAHIETRLLCCDHLLAVAHGRAAAWFGNPDRLALSAIQVAAIDEVNDLSIDLLKHRVRVLTEWRNSNDQVATIQAAFNAFKGVVGPAEAIAIAHEANLALGAWDGPEDTIKLMGGNRNVAS